MAAEKIEKPEVRQCYEEIENRFGFVPEFLKSLPDTGIVGAWNEFTQLYLNPNSALEQKTKDLIGMAVAAQAPCNYCTYMVRELAPLDSVSEEELKEAVSMAAITRHWSSVLNGLQPDELTFRLEVDDIMAHVKRDLESSAPFQPGAEARTPFFASSEEAYRDIQKTFGTIPDFFRRFPYSAVAGAWMEMKYVQLNPSTAIPPKIKELIGLAVASQIPCRYCVYFHIQAARLYGASEAEIQETLAVAAISRHWSVVWTGARIDHKLFQREVRQLVVNMQNQRAA